VYPMARKILVRLVGALTCMAAVVTGLDAEAGWRHRRCCAPSCCYTSCAAPSCNTCYDSCGCTTACTTWRDACGYCHTSCGWTVVSTPVVTSSCCVAATTPAPAAPAAQTATPTPAKPVSAAR